MKTNIAGAILAALYVIQKVQQDGKSLEDWKTWIVPAGIAVLAYFTADKKN